MRINEIFNSLDGEQNGWHGIGQPTTFIRCQGCNLRCKWCDTLRAQDCTGGVLLSLPEIVQQCPRDKVTITGGEPLMQVEELVELVWLLDRPVTIETNGSYDMPLELTHDGRVRWVVDYKMPSSDILRAMNSAIFDRLDHTDVIKFVVADMDELQLAKTLIKTAGWNAHIKYTVSPMLDWTMGYDPRALQLAKDIAQDISQDMTCTLHLSVQLHKLLNFA